MSKAEIIKRLKELVEGDNLNNYWLKEKIEEILFVEGYVWENKKGNYK